MRKLQPHIIIFQETRKKLMNTPSYNYINKLRDEDDATCGGGIAIGVCKQLTFRDLSKNIPEELSELEILFVQVVNSTFEMFVFNIYLSSYNKQKKLLKPLQERDIYQPERMVMPDALIVVSGDFNCAKQPIQYLHPISCDNEITFRRKHLNTVRESRTDWVLLSKKIEHRTQLAWTKVSDHACILVECEIPIWFMKANHIKTCQTQASH